MSKNLSGCPKSLFRSSFISHCYFNAKYFQNIKSFFFLLFISWACCPSFAQQSGIKFAHLTTAEGLSQSNVKILSRTVMALCGLAHGMV
jgi:hypothetical protein